MKSYLVSHQSLPYGSIDVEDGEVFFSNDAISRFIRHRAKADKVALVDYIAQLPRRLRGSWTVSVISEEERALL